MKAVKILSMAIAGISILSLSWAVYASDDMSIPKLSSSYTDNSKSYLLALNETGTANQTAASAPTSKPAEFKPPLFTMSKAHQYLGLGTLVMMGLTVVTNPGEGCEESCVSPAPPRKTSGTAHTRFARAAAGMAVATVASGLITHWDDFHFEDGFTDPDNMHALLGAAGAGLMTYAVLKSARSTTETSHAGMAELGGLAMAVAVKLTW